MLGGAMGSRVFVLNAGSSSLKYRLIDVDAGRALEGGVVEDVAGDHAAAVRDALAACPLDGVVAVAHRVVHGGERFRAPVVVDDAVLHALRALSALAPLHTPAGVAGIELARRALPAVPHVALFDTAFHHT